MRSGTTESAPVAHRSVIAHTPRSRVPELLPSPLEARGRSASASPGRNTVSAQGR